MEKKMVVENINGRWTVNGKIYAEMSEQERNMLSDFILDAIIDTQDDSSKTK